MTSSRCRDVDTLILIIMSALLFAFTIGLVLWLIFGLGVVPG